MYPWYRWGPYGTYPTYSYGMGNVPWLPFFPGWGRGFGRMFWVFPWLYSAMWGKSYPGMSYPFMPPMTGEQEKQMLENEMQTLQQRIEAISKRLAEIG